MIIWIIYIIISLILIFVMYLAILGINRGVKAKNTNKVNLENKLNSPKKLANEIRKLQKLYNDGAINKKEFNINLKSTELSPLIRFIKTDSISFDLNTQLPAPVIATRVSFLVLEIIFKYEFIR